MSKMIGDYAELAEFSQKLNKAIHYTEMVRGLSTIRYASTAAPNLQTKCAESQLEAKLKEEQAMADYRGALGRHRVYLQQQAGF